MNQYETVFILNPVLSEDQVKEAVDKYVGLLEREGREHYQQRKLGPQEDGLPNPKEKKWLLPLCRIYSSW